MCFGVLLYALARKKKTQIKANVALSNPIYGTALLRLLVDIHSSSLANFNIT